MIENIHVDGLDEICNAIVIKACKDYRIAYRNKNKGQIKVLEEFFYGGEFGLLVHYKIDPDYVVKELRRQAKDKNFVEKNRANLVMAYARTEKHDK